MKELKEYITEASTVEFKVDSLMEILDDVKDDTNKIYNTLCRMISGYMGKFNKNESIEILNRLNESGIKMRITDLRIGEFKQFLSDLLSPLPPSKTADLSFVNVSEVHNMYGLFEDTNIRCNIDLSSWDVSNVDCFDSMFFRFKGNIIGLENWNTSKAQIMGYMFMKAPKFNADLSRWDVSKVRYMDKMFNGAKSFDSNLENWDISKVTSKFGMFDGSGMKKLPSWYV